MKITEKEIQGLLPNLRGLPNIDPRTETRINEAFRRVYEFFIFKLTEQEKNFNSQIQVLTNLSKDQLSNISSLVGVLSQPLVGSGNNDPVLQNLISAYAPKSSTEFLGGPTPSFRVINSSEIPSVPASQLDANGTILDVNQILDGEYVKRIGNTLVSDFPVGTTTLADGTLPNAEGNLYTVPANHKTKIRQILLYNNSAGPLTASIRIRDNLANLIYTNNYNLLALQKIIVTLDIKLDAAYLVNGFTSVVGAIEFTIFGIEETQ